MLSTGPVTELSAISRYEAIAPRLPTAKFPSQSIHAENLSSLIDDIDCFVLDGFGVLNVGDSSVPSAPARIQALRAAGKTLRVLTNGASFPSSNTTDKYRRWGIEFAAAEVISSRDALAYAMTSMAPQRWGFVARPDSDITLVTDDAVLLADDPRDYADCDGFVLLGTGLWTDARHQLMIDALREKPRTVLVGNPDLVAPHPHGLSHEPGLFAHELADLGLCEPQFFGKPFDNAFARVRETLAQHEPSRIAMVGDTLHTDILGGAQCGWRTVLVTGHGLMKGGDVEAAIQRSGIRPDFIVSDT